MGLAVPSRTIGPLNVSALGLGCMGMSWAYGTPDAAAGEATIHHAVDNGVDFIDTAEVYGPYTNEELVGRALKGRRDRVTLATKFGFRIGGSGADGSAANARAAIDGSLKRLGVDVIDLWYLHRVDPDVPIEETVGAMAEAVHSGKVRYIGLSEAAPDTIRRAHATLPIAALQSEYSLWTRDPEGGVLDTVRELGIGFVAYSPLGRGFLTGTIETDKLEAGDNRRNHPRFSGDNEIKNAALVAKVKEIAKKHDATAAQIALAWVLLQGEDIVPIFGTTKPARIDENLGSLEITLSQDDRETLNGLASEAAGQRYPEGAMKLVQR
jgi:aryl-alcohol dehydrogenase-like predicted oxidoreductase